MACSGGGDVTQPTGKRGPVSPGAAERFGNSRAGMSQTLASIQASARGVAEWIDGLATGTGNVPEFAHDHRGGVWGRPLGVGYSFPLKRSPSGTLEAVTFCNVPDPRNLSGDDLDDTTANGGYTFVDVWSYVTTGNVCEFHTATWDLERQEWGPETVQAFNIGTPGAPPGWVKAASGLHLPPGFVRIRARDAGSTLQTWQWCALVVPQR